MKYRRLGSTNLTVSVIGIGTWQFGGEWGKDFEQGEVDAMFRRAKELGVNLIDTAECYGDHTSEAFVGNAIQRDRADWIVATKFGHQFHGPMNRSEPRTPADVQQQLDDSLRALKTDYIDIYQYHSWGDEEFNRSDVLELLHKQKQAGKIRHLGNSIGSNTNVIQADACGRCGIEVAQIVYNRLNRAPEEKVFPSCRRQDVGVLARVPLASGYLSGKYRPGATFKESDVRHRHQREEIDEKLREVEDIRRKEVPPGVDMARWALAWCLRHPAVTCVIPGCKDVGQVESNAAAAELISA